MSEPRPSQGMVRNPFASCDFVSSPSEEGSLCDLKLDGAFKNDFGENTLTEF
jgi:hypothetical protein